MTKRRKPKNEAVPEAANVPEPTPLPVTPNDLISASCPQCGALLPRMLSRLDAIPGQEHLRRAVTVAMTGVHSITFMGTGSTLPDALAYGRISRAYGLTAFATTPCRCGNHGDPFLTCMCSPEAIAAWRNRREFHNALQSDIVVEPSIPSAEQRLAHRRGRRGVTDEEMIAQAAEARRRPRPSDELDGTSQRLLTAALRQLQLSTEQVARMLTVARSIAQLADVPAIAPAHLAEALQYRARITATSEVVEPEPPADRNTEE
jgi:predicted ATPase with chaperone activity